MQLSLIDGKLNQIIKMDSEFGSVVVLIRCVAVLLSVLSTSPVMAQTSVWKVSNGTDNIYLGGTIHVLKPSDYPLPVEFNQAYEAADRLILETDIRAAQEPQGQQQIMQAMQARPEEAVDRVLTPHTYSKLMRTFGQYGLSLSSMRQFKVSMMMITLTLAEMSRLGINQTGVDEFFLQRAVDDGMAVGELESFGDQIQFIADMGKGNEERFVTMSLTELTETETMMEAMVASWRSGDMASLTTIFVEDMQKNYPVIYQQLMVERNNNWVPNIEKLFNQPGTELVLVGVGHIPGESGLIRQLEKRGYRVEPLLLK